MTCLVACIEDNDNDPRATAVRGGMDLSCKIPAGVNGSRLPQLLVATLDINRGRGQHPVPQKPIPHLLDEAGGQPSIEGNLFGFRAGINLPGEQLMGREPACDSARIERAYLSNVCVAKPVRRLVNP